MSLDNPHRETVSAIAGDQRADDAELKRLGKYFRYLDILRESGVTNMYGATPYLEKRFGIGRDEASEALGLWMSSFSHAPIPERVRAAIAKATGAGQ